MQIMVEYSAQLRAAASTAAERIEVPAETTLGDLLQLVGERHGSAMRELLLDSSGDIHPWLIADCNGSMQKDPSHRLSAGDRIRLLSPISGG